LIDTALTEGRGKGKIKPKQLVDEFFRNFKNDKFESNQPLRLTEELLV
jgi:hypothetical protein